MSINILKMKNRPMNPIVLPSDPFFLRSFQSLGIQVFKITPACFYFLFQDNSLGFCAWWLMKIYGILLHY